MTKKSVENRIIDRLSEFNKSLRSGDKISEKYTCRKVTLKLEPTSYGSTLVKETRKEILCVSQAIFAMFLGVSLSTVQSWEQGKKEPSKMACRFLDEIRRAPQHWRGRIRDSLQSKEVV